MIEALFTSISGGDQLRKRILTTIDEALSAAGKRRLDLHVMTFSFTDQPIATRFIEIASHLPNARIRIIADWTQGSPLGGQHAGHLAQLALPNLRVRYKLDQPYTWDAGANRLRWSYRTSRGLLHHKTLGILIDGQLWKLVCGSFNWTKRAANGYENLLIIDEDTAESRALMLRMELEFEALWTDGRATLSPSEAVLHYHMIKRHFLSNPMADPKSVTGLLSGTGGDLPAIEYTEADLLPPDRSPAEQGEKDPNSPQLLVAFSSRSAHEEQGGNGFGEENRKQRFWMQKRSGFVKRVPLTITTLALDTILSASPGDTLLVAMYGLSYRVPEYGALLDAARRGVRVRILLDGSVGQRLVDRIADVRRREGVPLAVRAGCRMMHQKYIVHPETATTLTGTANMTVDASDRHAEHRIMLRANYGIAHAFIRDFDTIWGRLSTVY